VCENSGGFNFMKEIPLSKTGKHKGKYVALVDDEMYPYLIHWSWQVDISKRTHYACRHQKIDGKQVKIYMHRFILGLTDPKIEPDHIDHNGWNNQGHNLRLSGRKKGQAHNMRKTERKCSSPFKGVNWDKEKKKWNVKTCLNRKQIWIGRYDDPVEAAHAYDRKAIELFGEHAHTNFPKSLYI